MDYFNNRMFNCTYVNQAYYKTSQPIQVFNNDDKRIAKAVNAIHDLCDAVKGMDEECQQKAFLACLAQMAKDLNWK